MDIEIITIERSSDEPHDYNESNTMSQKSRRQTTIDNEIFRESNVISNRWYVFSLIVITFIHIYISYIKRFCSRVESHTIRLCMFAIFISIAMIVGILTVRFTSPESSMFFIFCLDR